MSVPATGIDRLAAEGVLFREARLLDEWRLEEWLTLWVGEGSRYWLPCGDSESDPDRKISLVYDDWQRLNERVIRLDSGDAHEQDPRSELTRVVSNIELTDASASTVHVASKFVLGEFRRDVQKTYMGTTTHELVNVEGELLIRSKKVLLLNRSGVLDTITFPF